jgi:hypothetical protein
LEKLRDLVGIPAQHLGQPEHVVEPDQCVGDDEATLG